MDKAGPGANLISLNITALLQHWAQVLVAPWEGREGSWNKFDSISSSLTGLA